MIRSKATAPQFYVRTTEHKSTENSRGRMSHFQCSMFRWLKEIMKSRDPCGELRGDVSVRSSYSSCEARARHLDVAISGQPISARTSRATGSSRCMIRVDQVVGGCRRSAVRTMSSRVEMTSATGEGESSTMLWSIFGEGFAFPQIRRDSSSPRHLPRLCS
jgi:hypothetical protein